MDFYVGQKVVCMEDGHLPQRAWDRTPVSHWIARGNTYVIRRVSNRKNALVWLRGINRARDVGERDRIVDGGFFACRFRPLVERKTSIEIFQRLLLPSEKEKELETMTGNPNLNSFG